VTSLELVPAPGRGRVFERTLRPGIADCVAGGRARLDAIARWLQDVAYLDLLDARVGAYGDVGAEGFEARGMWVLRRARLRAEEFPRFGEELSVRTFCSGLGRFAAERRTTIEGERGRVEAVAIWICLEPVSLRPQRFAPEFVRLYGESAAERPAPVHLGHPGPPTNAEWRPWSFRASDVDVVGHVNNSQYWTPLEEELAAGGELTSLDAEIEHHDPAQPGEVRVGSEGRQRWVTSADGALYASILLL
jgi:acyl-ACP thioesterase